MKYFKNNLAFSLIEVLLMVTLFAIILSSTVSIVGTKTSREDLNAKASQVVGFIKQAHDYSMAGYQEDVWAIKVLDNDALCEDNGDCMVLYKGRDWGFRDSGYDKFLNFNTGVYIDESQENDFYFGYLSGWLSMGTSSTSSQSIVLNSNLGETRTILVESSGLVFDYYCGDNKCPAEVEDCSVCHTDCGLCSPGHLAMGIGAAYDVLLSDDYGYSANFTNGYAIFDASNPTSLGSENIVDTNGYAMNLEVVDNILYLADNIGGLKVIDISDKQNPVISTTLSTTGNDLGVAVNEDKTALFVEAFVVGCSGYCGTAYLYSYDISSDPSNPSYLDTITLTLAGDIVIEGDYLYLGWDEDGGAGLSWYDISDPSNLTFAGNVGLSQTYSNDYIEDVVVHDDYVYVAMRTYGVHIVSTSTASLADVYDTPGSVYGLEAVGDTLFVADNNTSLLSLSLSNAPTLTLNRTYDLDYVARKIFYSDDWLYVGDSDGITSIHIPQ